MIEDGKKTNKWLYLVGIVFFLIMAISVAFIIKELKYSAKLDILVAPLSAEIRINDKIYKNGVYGFEPGEINVSIEKDGFLSESRTIVLESGTITELYLYLTPLDYNKNWYLEHNEDMEVMMMIGGSNADAKGEIYSTKYPIISILPIIYANYDEKWNYTEFRIDGGMFDSCSQVFCLKITDTTGENRERALKLIEEKGFDPNDYEILYEYRPIVPLE